MNSKLDNATTKANNARTNGVNFERRFLKEMQKYIPSCISSQDAKANQKYYCDIISDDFLIEVKSHRATEQPKPLAVFRKISQDGLDKSQTENKECGFFFQLLKLCNIVKNHNKRVIIIVGCYSREVNAQFNLWLNREDQAFANYCFYQVLFMDDSWSGTICIYETAFWSNLKGKTLDQFFAEYKQHIKGGYHGESFENTDGVIREILSNIENLTPYTQYKINLHQAKWSGNEERYFKIGPSREDITSQQQLEIKIDQPILNCVEKEKQSRLQPTQEIKIDDISILSKDQLELIESEIQAGTDLYDISKKLNRDRAYLGLVLRNDGQNYTSEEWTKFRRWASDIMLKRAYKYIPTSLITSLDYAKSVIQKERQTSKQAVNRLKKINQEHIDELRNQAKEIKELYESIERQKKIITEQEEEIKAMGSTEIQEDKGLSQLQQEAYQAEIESHKISNEELKACIKRSKTRALETEIVNLKHEREELEEELEEQKSMTESLRNNIHNAYQKDLERYRKVIDMLLEQLDKQDNE